jgi:hypothetical protein
MTPAERAANAHNLDPDVVNRVDREGLPLIGYACGARGPTTAQFEAAISRAERVLGETYQRPILVRRKRGMRTAGIFVQLDRRSYPDANAQIGIILSHYADEDRKRELAQGPIAASRAFIRSRPSGLSVHLLLAEHLITKPNPLTGKPGWQQGERSGGYHFTRVRGIAQAARELARYAPPEKVMARQRRERRRRRAQAEREALAAVHERTFAALKAAKGSAERQALNQDITTSEYSPEIRWCVITHISRTSHETREDALAAARRFYHSLT